MLLRTRFLTGLSLFALAAFVPLVACSSSSSTPTQDGDDASVSPGSDSGISSAVDASKGAQDGSMKDASTVDANKSATCAATFGMALTPKFGRFDGIVTAIVPPGDNACALPNSTHLVIQGKMNDGLVYRMVVDVLSTIGSPDVSLYEMDAPLAGGMPWTLGWHDTLTLDYVTDLSVHNTSFVPTKQAALVARITDEINLGDHISVFATSGSTEPHSAHLVHRNATNADGAIILNPEAAKAHYILLAFGEQVF